MKKAISRGAAGASIMALLLAPFVPCRPTSAAGTDELDNVVALLELVLQADESTAVACLDKLSQQARTGELTGEQLTSLRQRLEKPLQEVLAGPDDKLVWQAALVLSALWGDAAAAERLRKVAADPQIDESRRISAVETLAARQDQLLRKLARQWLTDTRNPIPLRSRLLDSLASYPQAEVGRELLELYPSLAPELQPKVIGLIIQRPAWGKQLLAVIQQGTIAASLLNANQIQALVASRDPELAAHARQLLGTVRTERNPEREQVIAQMRERLLHSTGNALQGQAVFQKVCGQCHKMHGAGQDVGPDITRNGRASFDQLLSNVLDPSLVIGPAYQAVTVITQDGRVLTGLISEDNEQRLALKTQGGKVETIPRDDIDEVAPSQLSLMPEGLERQLTPQEFADLFAFLTLDRPPQDPNAQPIPGTPVAQ